MPENVGCQKKKNPHFTLFLYVPVFTIPLLSCVSFSLSTSVLHDTYTPTEMTFEIQNLKSYLYF